MKKMKRRIDHSWDFANVDTKYCTHGIHPYPAMMIPQVSHRLIAEYGKDAKKALDPFCGSGSVLLEFETAGVDSYGIDINPLAAMMSRVKTKPLSPAVLRKKIIQIKDRISDYSSGKPVSIVDFQNLDFWFKPQVIRDLSLIRRAIDLEKDVAFREFFLVCFSETVRKASNTRGSEFKLYRIAKEKLALHNPNAKQIFLNVVERNISGMTSLFEISQNKSLGNVAVINADAMHPVGIPEKSIDLIVSSPPYGDSRTTVAYGQFSRLSLQWLGFPREKVIDLDNRMLGGKPTPDFSFDFSSPTLDKIVKEIAKIDDLRAREVLSFYVDFQKAAIEINKLMRSKSTVCLVVGNRTVKGIQIPTDEIMAEIFQGFGYLHGETIVRRIPSKRMPIRNSPSNVVGKTLSTMNEEYIVILTRK